MTERIVHVAALAQPVRAYSDARTFREHMRALAAEATAAGAELLVFPEYGAVVLATITTPRDATPHLALELDAVIEQEELLIDTFAEIARTLDVEIVAPSTPSRRADGAVRNRAWVFGPGGARSYQEKLAMTRFERDDWGVEGGDELVIFDLRKGRLAVLICYDAELPDIARAAVEAGAEILAVPSCTEALSGYARVRIACQARALEGQCYVVQAPLVGEAPWSLAIDRNVGAAGVFVPPDRAFRPNGVLAIGEVNAPGWVHAELDLDAIGRARADGEVLTFVDFGRLRSGGRWRGRVRHERT